MQAIYTKFLSETDTKGKRIKARTTSGISKTVDWDDSVDAYDNHKLAMAALHDKMEWKWVRFVHTASIKDDGYVFICTIYRYKGLELHSTEEEAT